MHGGDLFIEFEKDGRIFMTGPVVYIGKITVAEQFFCLTENESGEKRGNKLQ